MSSRGIPNIWQLQAQRNIAGIIHALDTRDPGVRRRAISALRALDAKESIPRLQSLLENEFNPEMRDLIESTLQHLLRNYKRQEPPQQDQKTQLFKMLESGEPEQMLRAIHELSHMNDRTVVEHLIMVFRNPKLPVKVRLESAEALLKLESAPATVSLLGALRKSDWQVRRNAAAVLGQLEADWCVEPLIKAMRSDPQLPVRKTAAAALRRINTPEAQAAWKNSEFAQGLQQSSSAGTTGPLTPPAALNGPGSLPPLVASPAPAPVAPRQTGPLSPAAAVPPPPPPLAPAVPAPAPMPSPPPPTATTAAVPPAPPPSTPAAAEAPSAAPESTSSLPDLTSLPQPAWLKKRRPAPPPSG